MPGSAAHRNVNRVPPSIAVFLLATDEGRLAQRSIRSALRAARFASSRGLEVELHAVLDGPSRETVACFERNRASFVAVHVLDAGDRERARRAGASETSAPFLAFLDATALVSESWLVAAHAMASEEAILHPEASLFFGAELALVQHVDSARLDPLERLAFDPWTEHTFVASKLYRDEGRFTLAPHRVVPGTAHFLERRPGGPATSAASLCDALCAAAATGRESHPVALPPRRGLGKALVALARLVVGDRPALKILLRDLLEAARRFRRARPRARPPAWLLDEWGRAHELEPRLFPTAEALASLVPFEPGPSRWVGRYPAIAARSGTPTHCFLLPWLRPGGADLEALHLIRAVVEESARNRVLVVTTEDEASPWRERLPAGVSLLEVGRELRDLDESDRAALALRLLLHKKPGVVHVVNSGLGFGLLVAHGRELAAGSRLFVSAFCDDVRADGRRVGWVTDHLPSCFERVSGVLSDNARFVDELCERHGYERARFHVVPFPAPAGARRRPPRLPGAVLQVLWAGRFDRQKRPDVLLAMARRLEGAPVRFHVYGEAQLEPMRRVLAELGRRPNVELHGRFSGFGSLPVEDHDVFLYTSQWDGLPNVLLEAIAADLVVVAPDVGGIRELIDPETGFFVSGAEAVDEYVAALDAIRAGWEDAAGRARAARRRIEERHAWPSFLAHLRAVPGYLTRPA